MRAFLQIITHCCILFTVGSLYGQARLTALVSPAVIHKDEYTQLELTVENAQEVKEVVPPSLKDFTIISGPNQVNGMSNINGVITRYISITYIIKPTRSGRLSIGQATAHADGLSLKSNPITLEVINAFSGNTQGNNSILLPFSGTDPFAKTRPETPFNDYILHKGENSTEKINKNMFVRAEVNKTTCYVGEPVIVAYKLYTRLKSESNLIKSPSLNGFSVIDLQQPDNTSYVREKVNGKEYNVYILRKAQLYPLQAGNLELETAQLENKVEFIKEKYAHQELNSFNDVFRDLSESPFPPEAREEHSVILQSKPVFISVKPLPETNKPVNFKGAVGRFEITGSLTRNNFTTDDAGKLIIVINGQGNLQMVNAPNVKWPAGMEAFEPKVTDELNKLSVPVNGKKVFEFAFTVPGPGEYTIPPVELSYYDVNKGQYKSSVTGPFNFTVTRGIGKKNDTVIVMGNSGKERFFNKVFNHRLWIIIVLIVFIMAGLITWLLKENKRDKLIKHDIIKEQNTQSDVKMDQKFLGKQVNVLENVSQLLKEGNPVPFYQALNRALQSYLTEYFNIPGNEFNKRSITEHLDARGVSNETVLQLKGLMDEIEWHLYTPFLETEKMPELYQQASAIIELLNTYKS